MRGRAREGLENALTDGKVGVNDRQIWAADCETDPFKYGRLPEPFIWGAYNVDTGDYEEFDRTDDFLAWATSGKKLVYAHNGGKFDWHFIARHIPSGTKLKVINGRLAKFKIGECEFRDSWNILPLPLAAYKKDEFDYKKMERDVRHKHMDEIRRYLRNDCSYLADLIREFVDNHGTKLTLAGAAMSFWEKMTGEKADKTDESFYNRFSKFYAGGRVEVFHQGEITNAFGCYDIRSAYPDAMLQRHPYGSSVTVWNDIADTDEEIGRSLISLECESHGGMPFRDPETGSLTFPADGERRLFHIGGWEYLACRDTGTLRNPVIQAVYEFADTVEFGGYVTHWFGEKNGSPKGSARNIIAKFFLNSLYGKFGANPANYADYEVIDLADLYPALANDWKLENIEDDKAFVSRPVADFARRYYNVATAASITSYVRAKLWRAICGAKGVLYCDTDMIAANDPGNIEIHDTKLGTWEKEADCDYGYIAGRKLYAFHLITPVKGKSWKMAAKGVKLTWEEIREVALGNEHIVSLNDAPTFRVDGNVLYAGEIFGYVKRDAPEKMFQRRRVRMVRK